MSSNAAAPMCSSAEGTSLKLSLKPGTACAFVNTMSLISRSTFSSSASRSGVLSPARSSSRFCSRSCSFMRSRGSSAAARRAPVACPGHLGRSNLSPACRRVGRPPPPARAVPPSSSSTSKASVSASCDESLSESDSDPLSQLLSSSSLPPELESALLLPSLSASEPLSVILDAGASDLGRGSERGEEEWRGGDSLPVRYSGEYLLSAKMVFYRIPCYYLFLSPPIPWRQPKVIPE